MVASLLLWPAGTLPGSVHLGDAPDHPASAQKRGAVVTERPIKAGDLLHLTRAASVQFVSRPIVVRVIRHLVDRQTYHGWTWIEAYQLDVRGEAVAKRELFVWRKGLRWVAPGSTPVVRRPARGVSGARVRT